MDQSEEIVHEAEVKRLERQILRARQKSLEADTLVKCEIADFVRGMTRVAGEIAAACSRYQG